MLAENDLYIGHAGIGDPSTAVQPELHSDHSTSGASLDATSPPLLNVDFSSQNMSVEEMECPHSKVGVVIGAKGVIIQEIMRRTNCRIVVLQDGLPDGQPRHITITGNAFNISLAKNLLQAVISDGPGALQGPVFTPRIEDENNHEDMSTEDMTCAPDKVGIIIGSKGMVIQDIMRRTFCKISVNQSVPEGSPRIITIIGKPSDIAKAKELITAVVNDGPTALSMNETANTSYVMDCPQDKVGVVIGAKGAIVQDIMRRCGCRIVIDQDFPPGAPRKIIFTGTDQQVEAGKIMVTLVMLHGPSSLQMAFNGTGPILRDIKIQQAQVGRIIGPGGNTIKEMQQRCGVKMNIEQVSPESEERRLRIIGDGEKVDNAVQLIMQLVDHGTLDVPPPVFYEPGTQGLGADGRAGRLLPPIILPNGMTHQVAYISRNFEFRVVGNAAANINLITMKSGATLHVDHNRNTPDTVQIDMMGAPEHVTLAAQMVQEILINGPEFLYSLPNVVALQPQVLEPLSASLKKMQAAPPLAPTLSSTLPPAAIPHTPSPGPMQQQQMHIQMQGRRLPQQPPQQQRFGSASAPMQQHDVRRPASGEFHMVSPTVNNSNHYQVISPPELLPSLVSQGPDASHRHGYSGDIPPLHHANMPHLNQHDIGMPQPAVSDAYHVHSSSSLSSLSSAGHHGDAFQILPPSITADSGMHMHPNHGTASQFNIMSPLDQTISPSHSSHMANHVHSQYGVMSPPLEQSFSTHHAHHAGNHIPAQHAKYGGMASLEQTITPHSSSMSNVQHSRMSASAPEFHISDRFPAPPHSGPLSSDVTFQMLSAPVDMAADLNDSFSNIGSQLDATINNIFEGSTLGGQFGQMHPNSSESLLLQSLESSLSISAKPYNGQR